MTSPRIAVFELVKNSYDAGAPHSWIIFKDVKSGTSPRIIIVDDGVGMSKVDIRDKWLFVGYSEKKEDAEADPTLRRAMSRRHRVFAGAKGIGRFSCDTLGSHLVMHTKKSGESTINRLEVKWEEFEEDQNREFQKVKAAYTRENSTSVEGFDLSKMRSGTILEISQLRNQWTVEDLRDLKRYLQRLVSPEVSKDERPEFEIIVKAEEFAEDDAKGEKTREKPPAINGPVRNFVFERLGLKTTSIEARIEGQTIRTELVDKENLVYGLSEDNPYKTLNGVHARIFYLNRGSKIAFGMMMGVAPKDYGSVFLYKNEFRIHPYGDTGNDWLGLEERKGQGIRRYLSRRDIIGRVQLVGSQESFKETASRDSGVIENRAFRDLVDFVIEKVIKRLERYVVGVMDWDRAWVQGTEDRREVHAKSVEFASKLVEGTKSPNAVIRVGPNLLQTLDAKLTDAHPEILGNLLVLQGHVRGSKERGMIQDVIDATRKSLAKAEAKRAELESAIEARTKQVQYFNRVMSPDDKLALSHLHTVKVLAGDAKKDLTEIREFVLAADAPKEVLATLDNSIVRVRKIVFLSQIATKASFDLGTDETEGDIVAFLREYLRNFGYHRLDVLQTIEFEGDEMTYTAVFSPLNLTIIFDNLLDNSRKHGGTIVKVRFSKMRDGLEILVGDNGRGVQPDSVPHLFEMGYSTVKGGSGLGLYEIKRICEAVGWQAKFVGNEFRGMGTGACFELDIR